MFGALSSGGALVIVDDEVAHTPPRFLRLIRDEGVTVLNQVPSVFRRLAEAFDQSDVNDGLSLETVIFGGEPVDVAAVRRWVDRDPDPPRFCNMYGITETTVHVTAKFLEENDLRIREDGATPIGMALPHLEILVVDENGTEVAPGGQGEIYVGGGGVSQGYVNEPELTCQRFVEVPGREGRYYVSGDIARIRDNGELEYLGRLDDQVKVRGFRIELGEIEVAMREVDNVEDAAVVVEERPSGARTLAAAVCLRRGRATKPRLATREESDRLRAALASMLPAYMIPSTFIVASPLPLLPSGKRDRVTIGTWISTARSM
jgi:non-ribosomal peptide synthetase component F